MIGSIRLSDYRNSADCRAQLMTCRDAFQTVSFELKKGNAYGFVSDFGCGNWGLVTCIGGRGDDHNDGEIQIDGHSASAEELRKHSAFLFEKEIPELGIRDRYPTVEEGIREALKISHLDLTVYEIKDLFHLTDERFDRPLDRISGEIRYASTAIQYALGKDIYCFPYMNQQDIAFYLGMKEAGIIGFLKEKGKIILLPTSQFRTALRACDHTAALIRTRKKTEWRMF